MNTTMGKGKFRGISRAFVVYDKTTGEILHTHRSITFESRHDRETPERQARRHAGSKAKDAAVLEVDPSEIQDVGSYKVDVANMKLIRLRSGLSVG